MKIKLLLILTSSFISQETNPDETIVFQLITNIFNINKIQNTAIFNNLNNYFHNIFNKFYKEKVSGMNSYNMNTISNIFIKNIKYYGRWDSLNNLQFKDKFQLYYINNDQLKYQNLIITSEKKQNFFMILNENLEKNIEKNLKSNNIIINNKSFQSVNLSSQKNNPKIANIYNNYLGNDICDITITPMEILLLKKSMEDDFYKKYDDYLKKIDLYCYIDYKFNKLLDEGIFFSLKKKIMENFLVKKFIEIENTYGENIHPYILDIKGNDLEKSFKKQLIKYFISREILLNMYNYVY